MTTNGIVTRELDRIEAITGTRPIDWMAEIEENAWETWIEGNECDIESFETAIIDNADDYIAFMKENYPEECKEEAQ